MNWSRSWAKDLIGEIRSDTGPSDWKNNGKSGHKPPRVLFGKRTSNFPNYPRCPKTVIFPRLPPRAEI
ncbi:hypothetical protein FOVSG1_009383 [Fusarium oxysporum f. sp. vasinfectum]